MLDSEVIIVNESEMLPRLEDRGICVEDVKATIVEAQNGAWRIIREGEPGRFMCRSLLGDVFNVYVDCKKTSDCEFELVKAYSHRLFLLRYVDESYMPLNLEGEPTKWMCADCGQRIQRVENVVMTFDDIVFPPIEGWRCPSCLNEMLPESIVMEKLAPVEPMLEAK